MQGVGLVREGSAGMTQQLVRQSAVTEDLLVALWPQQGLQHESGEQLQLQSQLV